MNKIKTDEKQNFKESFNMVWWNHKCSNTTETIQSLTTFFSKINKSNSNLGKGIMERNNTYQSSLYHFLLYYCSRSQPVFFTVFNRTLFYGMILGKNSCALHLCSPSYASAEHLISDAFHLIENKLISKVINTFRITSITLRDVDDSVVTLLRNNIQKYPIHITSIKRIPYAIYDLQKTLPLKGKEFSNIRWHLNKFNRANHTIKIRSAKNIEKPLLHLIGKWRRQAIHKRGFSFADVTSDKYGAHLLESISNASLDVRNDDCRFINHNNLFYRILEIDNQISSFHLGYQLGFLRHSDMCAHAIGITDLSIPHLAEYAQIDFWTYMANKGIRYVNDGPSWRKSLEIFKQKFRPIEKQNSYWINISLDELNTNIIKDEKNDHSSCSTSCNIDEHKFR